MNMIIFVIAAFVAQIFGTITGFGAATVLTPAASFIMDIKTAIFVVAVFHLIANLSRIGFFIKLIDKKIFLEFGLASLLFTVTGAAFSNRLNASTIKVIFGVFLLTYIFFSLAVPRFSIKPTRLASFLGGSCSGFVSGLIGTGGAIRATFLSAFPLEKERYIATSSLIALCVDLTRIPVYLVGGAYKGPDIVWYIPFMFLAGVGGAAVGRKIVHYISPVVFRRIVMGTLLVIGAHMFLEGLWGKP